MKVIYLVKKNPKLKNCNENWIQMNLDEFIAFKCTEEGKIRERYFAPLPTVFPDEEDFIYMEMDSLSQVKEMRRTQDHSRYLTNIKADSDISVYSLDEPLTDNIRNKLDQLESMDNVEEKALLEVELSRVMSFIKSLNENEKNLLYHLYLSPNPLELKDYARLNNLTEDQATSIKGRAIRKLKN